ncbi:hypothetical protein ACWIGE_14705 [Streptomyces diastaticus]|nr:hypothetical protein [Streptomyces sp. L06]
MTSILDLCAAAGRAGDEELLVLLRQAHKLYQAGLAAARDAPYGSDLAAAEFDRWADSAEAMAFDRLVEIAAHRGVSMVAELP